MQPLLLSSTTSLIVPTVWPPESFTVEPMILLVGMYSVVVVDDVVDEVWACEVAAMARPANANAAMRSDFFISV
jgi:hypothetical protein